MKYKITLKYLGDPSISLDEEIEKLARCYKLKSGTFSWDDTPFAREMEFFGENEKNINVFGQHIKSRYNGLCHTHIEPVRL
jgi:hypothetical protein